MSLETRVPCSAWVPLGGLAVAGLCLGWLSGCGHPPPAPADELAGFPAPPASQGFQLAMPPLDLPPSSDNEICTWTDHIIDGELRVKEIAGFQTGGGHHLVLYSTSSHQPPGTQRRCSDEDMVTLRLIAAVAGEGASGSVNRAPSDLVYSVPAGSQLVVNHHYINATAAPRHARSAVNLLVAGAGEATRPSGAVAFTDTSLMLPMGAASLDIHCKIPRPLRVWSLVPHMHEQGSHIIVELQHGGARTTLSDVQWEPGYMFHPPEMRRDPDAPLMLEADDELSVHCEWMNDTGAPLPFGREMCVAFGSTVEDSAAPSQACNAGSWFTF
jgi:hypothetical protein